jgi:hypothetical protein
MTVYACLAASLRNRQRAIFKFAFATVCGMAAYTSLIETLLVGFFHTHMGVVTIDAGEIDIRIVLVKVAFVGTLETGTHLEALRMSGHHKFRFPFVGWHEHRKHRV